MNIARRTALSGAVMSPDWHWKRGGNSIDVHRV